MHEMQMQEPQSHQGASHNPSTRQNGVLESANRVIIGACPGQVIVIADGAEVAVLEGHHLSGDFYCPENELKASIYDFTELNWTHRGAMLQLQGELISTILGPAICLMRCKHRVAGHPQPGMDEVRILVPLQNPKGLRTVEMFQLARKFGF